MADAKPTADQLARRCGASDIDTRVSWTWATFDTNAQAEEFIRLLNAYGHEHRGIYPDPAPAKSAAVRYR